jgi:Asp/Glu/hydantoin racemase
MVTVYTGVSQQAQQQQQQQEQRQGANGLVISRVSDDTVAAIESRVSRPAGH